MTLDGAIEHCEEVAEGMTEQGKCEECAAEHRQLANWLKELKDYRERMTAAESETKIGHWIIENVKEQGYDISGVKTWYVKIKCSECGFIKTAIEGHTGQYQYCRVAEQEWKARVKNESQKL